MNSKPYCTYYFWRCQNKPNKPNKIGYQLHQHRLPSVRTKLVVSQHLWFPCLLCLPGFTLFSFLAVTFYSYSHQVRCDKFKIYTAHLAQQLKSKISLALKCTMNKWTKTNILFSQDFHVLSWTSCFYIKMNVMEMLWFLYLFSKKRRMRQKNSKEENEDEEEK